jgi:hypothetical protein
MRYRATWTEERSDTVEAQDIRVAEALMMAAIRRSSAPDRVKLLSIYAVEDPPPPPPAPLASAA